MLDIGNGICEDCTFNLGLSCLHKEKRWFPVACCATSSLVCIYIGASLGEQMPEVRDTRAVFLCE